MRPSREHGRRRAVRSILHGEGAYEEGPEYPTKPITPHVIRNQIYWAIFSGGMHTYGNTNVWSFGSNPKYVQRNWKQALKSEGATYAGISRVIMEGLGWWEFEPTPEIIDQHTEHADTTQAVKPVATQAEQPVARPLGKPVAMQTERGERVIVYAPRPMSITLVLDRSLSAPSANTTWIDPLSGDRHASPVREENGKYIFNTPDGWEDGILLIE